MLFNLFPGMGAWHYTIRKAGFAVANDMVLSGKLYTAEQLYRRSLVDLVVDDGQGEAALDHVVRSIDPRLRGTLVALQGQRLAAPITYDIARRDGRSVGPGGTRRSPRATFA